jgi:single-strand DNA-binding protein
MLNQLQLIGNLGRKPEVRQAGGTSVCNLNVATTYNKKSDNGWEEMTRWVSVSVWGKDAENAAKYLDKGSKVYVEATVEDREKNGEYKTVVRANKVKYLSKATSTGAKQTKAEEPSLDDIPF